jgi:hypothetical protein
MALKYNALSPTRVRKSHLAATFPRSPMHYLLQEHVTRTVRPGFTIYECWWDFPPKGRGVGGLYTRMETAAAMLRKLRRWGYVVVWVCARLLYVLKTPVHRTSDTALRGCSPSVLDTAINPSRHLARHYQNFPVQTQPNYLSEPLLLPLGFITSTFFRHGYIVLSDMR